MAITRRLMAALAAAMAVAACGADAGPAKNAGGNLAEMALGRADAKVTMIEYASVTCGHCADFHANILPALKTKYIDTGQVRYVFREFRTPPQDVATAGFLLARCNNATPDQYFKRVDLVFKQQPAIFDALQRGQGRQALLSVAKAAGLSETQFDACIRDQASIDAMAAVEEAGLKEFKIAGTPTVIINGKVITGGYTVASLSAALDEALGVKPAAKAAAGGGE
jgi:protein-disulfide isomerase